MSDKIITTKHGDRSYKDCKCCVCGSVSKCTPSNDFYSTEEHGNGILCEKCFADYTADLINKARRGKYE